MRRSAALWALGALLGIVVTAAVTWATSTLTGQHIGLSSEPLSAGRSLAPRPVSAPAQSRSATTTVTRTRAVPAPGGVIGSSTTTTAILTKTTTAASEGAPRGSRRPHDDGASGESGGSEARGSPREGPAGSGSGGSESGRRQDD